MEEFDSEDFSTSDEDEDYVPSGERFGLRRKEGGSHASRLTRDFPGPQGVGLVVARPPRRVGSGVRVLRTWPLAGLEHVCVGSAQLFSWAAAPLERGKRRAKLAG